MRKILGCLVMGLVLQAGAQIWDIGQKVETEPFTGREFEFAVNPAIKAISIKGPEYQGKPTKIFAWYGVPENPKGKVPGIVLVHGGGGRAFYQWVELWMKHGYAAIAVGHSGNLPFAAWEGNQGLSKEKIAELSLNPEGGPLEGTRALANVPLKDQWFYHAPNAVILANSFLRSLPEVDSDKIGLTGISWGGFLTCLVAGVDSRFAFAIPVYGCGFLNYESGFGSLLQGMDKKLAGGAEFYQKNFDPANFVGQAKMPMLFINGTNDRFYWVNDWNQTANAAPDANRLMMVRFGHSHSVGIRPPEIMAFADSVTRGTPPLAKVKGVVREKDTVSAEYVSPVEIARAELAFTCDAGKDNKRKWQTVPAVVDSGNKKISVKLPEGCLQCYFLLADTRKLQSSSPVFTVE